MLISTPAATIWLALEDVAFARYGYPMELVTDNGLEFSANEIMSCFKDIGTTHIKTTFRHPQANGVTERFNHTLKETLQGLCNNNPSAWCDHLPKALWAYHMAEQAVVHLHLRLCLESCPMLTSHLRWLLIDTKPLRVRIDNFGKHRRTLNFAILYKQKCLREFNFAENRDRCSLLEQMFAIFGLE